MAQKKRNGKTHQHLSVAFAFVFVRRWKDFSFQIYLSGLDAEMRENILEHQRIVMRTFLGKVSSRVLNLGWTSWIAHRNESRRIEAETRHAVSHWLNRSKSSAFRTWHGAVLEAVRNRRIVARSLARLKSLRAHQAFNTWCDLVETRRRLRHRVVVMVARWRDQHLRFGMDGWRGIVCICLFVCLFVSICCKQLFCVRSFFCFFLHQHLL